MQNVSVHLYNRKRVKTVEWNSVFFKRDEERRRRRKDKEDERDERETKRGEGDKRETKRRRKFGSFNKAKIPSHLNIQIRPAKFPNIFAPNFQFDSKNTLNYKEINYL